MDDPNSRVRERIQANAAEWQALNTKETQPPTGTEWRLAFIADQDTDSKDTNSTKELWWSYLRWGTLRYDGDGYSMDTGTEHKIKSAIGDSKGRGAEYSALQFFQNKLLTFDDRTGSAFEIVAAPPPGEGDGLVRVEQLRDPNEQPLAVQIEGHAMKVEWTAVKGGKLIIGSTGSEFYAHDGSGTVEHERAQFVSALSSDLMTTQEINWAQQYNVLRRVCACEAGQGYMTHESGRWSDVHSSWFFVPRKICFETFDEDLDNRSCANLLLSVPESEQLPSADEARASWDADAVLVSEVLTANSIRGCADFLFIPGTSDCHLLIIRTEETDDMVRTYASVVDLEGRELMAETLVSDGRKYEGVELLNTNSDGSCEWEYAGILDQHATKQTAHTEAATAQKEASWWCCGRAAGDDNDWDSPRKLTEYE